MGGLMVSAALKVSAQDPASSVAALTNSPRVIAAPPGEAPGTNAALGQASRARLLAVLPPETLEVVRLSEAGLTEEVILSFIQKSPATPALNAEQLLALRDLGLAPRVIQAMVEHRVPEQAGANPELAAAGTPAPLAPAPAADYVPEAASLETVPDDYRYFQSALTPYGTWQQVPTYGWCWQPEVCRSRPDWRPYCDEGHWVWTDSGWFWYSSYPWGWAAFHYGRWCQHARLGWLWQPARAWAPAWVCWREAPQYCGWAPLPPEARLSMDKGWTFKGALISDRFDFGLGPAAFIFVPTAHFCDLNLKSFRLPEAQVNVVFVASMPLKPLEVDANKRVMNRGFAVTKIEAVTQVPIRQVTVASLPESQRPPLALAPNGQPVLSPTGRPLPPQPPRVPGAPDTLVRPNGPPPNLPAAPTLPAAPVLTNNAPR